MSTSWVVAALSGSSRTGESYARGIDAFGMGHSDSSDENAYGHESDGSSDRPAKKRNRLGTPGSFGSTSSPKKARAARPKLSSPWTYDLGLGGVAKHKNRKDLNISQGYGKKVAWPRSAGLRELIQNMFDGILAHLRESEGDNVSPRDIEVQETNPASVEQRPNQHMPFLPSGTKITFEFRRRKDPVAVPAKRKGKATDIPLLGWISIRIQYHTCDLELYNRGTPLDLDCLTFGHTSKEGQSGFIGQHGDGMKMGINAIIRQLGIRPKYRPSVIFVTGKNHWDFVYDDSDILMAHQTQSKLPIVKGVLTQVRGFPTEQVRFNEFLFLRPPKEMLEATAEGKRGEIGSILLDEEYRQQIFVKGVFVQKKNRTNGLRYGVDIWHNVHMGRDRVGLEDDVECAEAVYHIWQSLFPESLRGRQLFLELLLDSPECTEVHYIAEDDFMTKTDGELLFKQLREEKGLDSFFYYADDASESVRIIEQVLKKKPVWIPKQFYTALLGREVIRTPEQERRRKFKSFDVSARYGEGSHQTKHTHHVVEAFLDYDAATMQIYRDRYHFKEAPVETGIEVIPDGEGADMEFLFHELTLSRVYIHDKKQFKMCSRYLLNADTVINDARKTASPLAASRITPPLSIDERPSSDAEISDTLVAFESSDDPAQSPRPDKSGRPESETKDYWPALASVCDCSALHILNLMTQELQEATSSQKYELNMGRQTALKSMPRDLAFDFWDEDTGERIEPVLSWSIDDASMEFKIVIRREGAGMPLLTNVDKDVVTVVELEVEELRTSVSEVEQAEGLMDVVTQEVLPGIGDSGRADVEKENANLAGPQGVHTVSVDQDEPLKSQVQLDESTSHVEATPQDDDGSDDSESSSGESTSSKARLLSESPSHDLQSPEILLRSAESRLLLSKYLARGVRYNAQVCWDKTGTLYSPPLTFVLAPLPPASLDAYFTDGVLSVEWEDCLQSGADHWILIISCEDQMVLRREVVGLSWLSTITDVFDQDKPLHVAIYSASSETDVISPDCIEEQVFPKNSLPRDLSPPLPSTESTPRQTSVISIRDDGPSDYGSPTSQHRDECAGGDESDPDLGLEPGDPAGADVNDEADTLTRAGNSGRDGGPDTDSDTDSDKEDEDDGDVSDSEYEDEDVGSDEGEDDDDDMYSVVARKPMHARSETPSASHHPVDSILIGETNVKINHFYAACLAEKINDDGEVKVVLHIHSIQSPESEEGAPILQVSRYIYWKELYNKADSEELLLTFEDPSKMGTIHDAEEFRANEISHVLEEVDVFHEQWSSEPEGFNLGLEENLVCRWAYRSRGKGMFSREVTLVPVGRHLQQDLEGPHDMPNTLPEIRDFKIGELFCGVGGSSCGFEAAGFDPSFGVDKDGIASLAFEINCRSAKSYNESVQTFLQRPWPENMTADAPLSVMLISPPCQGFSKANSGGKNDDENRSAVNVVPDALRRFQPAYMFYENVPHQMSKTHVHTLRKLEYEVLRLGYSLTYKILDASHYGVASSRKRLIVIAAATGRSLPAWPLPTHGGENQPPVKTLGNAIHNLQWDNSTCIKPSKRKTAARVDHPEDILQKVGNHCTGCSSRNVTNWNETATIPSWDEPIPTILTGPTDRWKCRHPKFTQRVLTVREMARAMSFPDHWRFKGSMQNQYKQVGNSVPPRLAEAVAWEIKAVLCASHPHLPDFYGSAT